MLNQEDATRVAKRLLDASQADETEVVIESVSDRFVRFADSGPTQSADRERHTVSVRARLSSDDGIREAKAVCDGVDEAICLATLDKAVQLAAIAPPNGELLALEGSTEVSERHADEATVAHSFEDKAAWVREATNACAAEGCEELSVSIAFSRHRSSAIFASSGNAFEMYSPLSP